jgi:hypothetical protein
MLRQGRPAPPALNCPFTTESCTVARPAGRERKPPGHAPPAHSLTVIGYTTTRDAILVSRSQVRSRGRMAGAHASARFVESVHPVKVAVRSGTDPVQVRVIQTGASSGGSGRKTFGWCGRGFSDCVVHGRLPLLAAFNSPTRARSWLCASMGSTSSTGAGSSRSPSLGAVTMAVTSYPEPLSPSIQNVLRCSMSMPFERRPPACYGVLGVLISLSGPGLLSVDG